MNDLSDMLIGSNANVLEAMRTLDQGGKGIAVIVDTEQKLVGIITDGDIRRAILGSVAMDASINALLQFRSPCHAQPASAPVGTSKSDLKSLMVAKSIRHIPLVDPQGKVVDLAMLDELVADQPLALSALIMAGGLGKRLLPLTEDLPKPMLPFGGQPLLARTVDSLRGAGVRKLYISTHYKPEKIMEYFGDGSRFGMTVHYLPEDQPLGTAGALQFMDTPDETLLVINGDILTQIKFRHLLEYHREQGADMTVCVREYSVEVPYGVVYTDGVKITELREKPSFEYFVNAGLYMLEPTVFDALPETAGDRFDMTELIGRLIKRDRLVISFPIREYWLDIGRHEDYLRAQEDHRDGKL